VISSSDLSSRDAQGLFGTVITGEDGSVGCGEFGAVTNTGVGGATVGCGVCSGGVGCGVSWSCLFFLFFLLYLLFFLLFLPLLFFLAGQELGEVALVDEVVLVAKVVLVGNELDELEESVLELEVDVD
jgi:hypothetical protein